MYYTEHPRLHLANVFLMISLEVRGLGRKNIETECHFHYILSKAHTIDMYLIIIDVNLDDLSVSPLQSFSFSSFVQLYSLEGVYCVPTFRE